MNESIARRVARLMSGSVNALVDAVENASPELVMEQAIREVDAAIADTRAELGQQVAQKHLASKKLIEENNRHEALAEQLSIAVSNERDDLAEAGIAEQMDIEARIPVLELSIADAASKEKELEGYWFDPTTGVYSFFGSINTDNKEPLIPHKRLNGGNDWVLVIKVKK